MVNDKSSPRLHICQKQIPIPCCRQTKHAMKIHSGLFAFRRVSIQRIFVILCSLLLVAPPQLLAQVSKTQSPENRRSQVFAMAEFDLSQVNEAQFDIQALQQQIGTEPDLLGHWVRTQTRWLPYIGALKGPHGTLMARQGNLLDRSLLLAALLEASGKETRIGHFDVTPEQRKLLRKAAGAQQTGGLAAFQPGAVAAENTLAEFQKQSGLAEDDASAALLHRVSEEKRLELALTDTLTQHQQALNELIADKVTPAARDHWTNALDRYYFVQYRETTSAPWKDAHLLPAGIDTKGSLDVFAPDEIPQNLLHRVDIKVVVTQKQGDDLVEKLAAHESIVTATTGASPLRIQFSPTNLNDPEAMIREIQESESLGPFLKRLEASRGWLPVIRLGEESIADAQVIDQIGNLAPYSSIGTSGGAGTLGTALEILEKNLGDGKNNDTAKRLEQVRLDFEISGPAPGKFRVISRPIYQRPADAGANLTREQLLARSLALCSRIELLLLGAHVSPDFAVTQRSQAKLGIRLVSDYIAAKTKDSGSLSEFDAPTMVKIAKKLDRFPTKLFQTAQLRRSADSFLAQPNILSFWSRIAPSGEQNLEASSSIDFIENAVESINTAALEAFQDRLAAGLRDSVVETVTAPGVDRSSAVSTSALFVADNRQGWQIIDSTNAGVIDTLNLPAIAHKAIQADLGGNFLVVLRPESNDGMTVWWRIHPQTGESLGMLASDNGVGGQVLSWKTVAVIVISLTALALIVAFGGKPLINFEIPDTALDEAVDNL